MTNLFDVFLEVLGNAVEMLSRPPFSYLILIAGFILCISTISRIVLRLVDLGSVEHEDEEEDEGEISQDDKTNIDWYISADDFTNSSEDEQ